MMLVDEIFELTGCSHNQYDMMGCCRGAFCVDSPASGLRPGLSALLRGVSVSQTLFTQKLRFSGASFAVHSRYVLSDQLGAACLWLGWLRSIDLGFDKCRETLGVILGAGTGVSWPRSAPTMPITAATIRRSVDMYAVHWFQRLLVVMRHGESTRVAMS